MRFVPGAAGGYPLSKAFVALSVGFVVIALVGRLGPGNHALRSKRRLALLGCAAAGLAGAVSNSKPTGSKMLDLAYPAILGVVVCLCARKAPRWLLLIAIVPAITFAILGSAFTTVNALCSFAPLGAAISLQLSPKSDWIARTITSVGIAGSVFFYPTDVRTYVPSLTAAAVSIVLIVGGVLAFLRTRATGRVARAQALSKRTRALATSVGFAAVLAAGAGVVFAARQVRTTKGNFETAVNSLSNAIDPVEALDVEKASAALGVATSDLNRARESLDRPLWRLAAVLPIAAQNNRAITSLANGASAVSVEAQKLVGTQLLKTLRRDDGSVDVSALDRFVPALDTLQQSLISLNSDVQHAASDPWVASPLADKATSFAPKVTKALSQVGAVKDASEHLPELLGATSTRRYLLVLPTLSESRGSGGLIGNFGEIEISNGKIALTRFDRINTLLVGGTPWEQRTGDYPPSYLTRYGSFTPKRYFQNLLVSPDFATNARIIAEQYPQASGRAIDGVISVDPYGLAALLALEGPLTVEGVAEPVTSVNAPKLLMYDLYVQAGERQDKRIPVLEDIARQSFERLREIPLGSPQLLISTIGPAFKSRHMQIWSRDAQSQNYLESIGASGSYLKKRAITGDTIGLVAQNAGGNKIDWFVDKSLDYEVEVGKDGTVSATATINVQNRAPSTGLPSYVIGNLVDNRVVPIGTASVLLSVYSPLELVGATVFGERLEMERSTEFGLNVYSALLDVPSMSREELVLTLSGKLDSLPVGAYPLEVLYQPLVNNDAVRVKLHTGLSVSEPRVELDLNLKEPTQIVLR